MTVGDVARRFDVTRPAISQHLAVLRDNGLVDPPSGGGPALYAVRPEAVAAARDAIQALADELPVDGARQRHDVVAVEVGARASAETVFAHLTDPELMSRWLGTRATLDPTPGGEFRVELSDVDTAAGRYVAVAPPSSVSFTWGQEGGRGALTAGATRVQVTVADRQAGALVRLEHHGLPAELRAAHLASWAHHLGALAAAAERQVAGDPSG